MSITVLGINGFLGKDVLEALTAPEFYQHLKGPLVVMTRDLAKVDQSNKQIIYKEVGEPDEWDDILKETDIFINLAGDSLDLKAAEAALKRNPPKLYIPSQFGADPVVPMQNYQVPIFKVKSDHSKAVRALGIRVLDMYTGSFDDDQDSIMTMWFGQSFDREANRFTTFGSEDFVWSTTYRSDIGKSIAAICAFHDVSELPKEIHIASNNITVRKLVERYEKAHSVKVTVEVVPLAEAQATSKTIGERVFKFEVMPFLYQIQTIASEGPGKGMSWSLEEREIINPKEQYFKWTAF